MLIDAAIDNPSYSWDKNVLRYRNKSTGRFISNSVVSELSSQRIQLVKTDLRTIGNLLADGKISLGVWQIETANTLKTLHAQQYILGKGGQSQVGKADYLEIARELKIQYKYLQNFAVDVRNGKMSVAQFDSRLEMYADASIVSFHRGDILHTLPTTVSVGFSATRL